VLFQRTLGKAMQILISIGTDSKSAPAGVVNAPIHINQTKGIEHFVPGVTTVEFEWGWYARVTPIGGVTAAAPGIEAVLFN